MAGKSAQVGPRLVDQMSPSQKPRTSSTGVESGSKNCGAIPQHNLLLVGRTVAREIQFSKRLVTRRIVVLGWQAC